MKNKPGIMLFILLCIFGQANSQPENKSIDFKLIIADSLDWNRFDSSVSELFSAIKTDRFNVASEYLNSMPGIFVEYRSIQPRKDVPGKAREFEYLAYLNRFDYPKVARVFLTQVTINIRLLTGFFNQTITTDVQVRSLGEIIQNIRFLSREYLFPFFETSPGSGKIMRLPKRISGPIAFKIFGKDSTELKNARCYLLSPYTCRRTVCKSCIMSASDCDMQKISMITTKYDHLHDTNNPVLLTVFYGRYHFFVIKENKILFYEFIEIAPDYADGSDHMTVKIYTKN